MKGTVYPSINGLRAISIFIVIMHHLWVQDYRFKKLAEINWLKPITHFIMDGQMGVNVFFVISGFLITSLMLQEENLTKSISLKKFYISRILRIFPAYYSLLIVYFFLQFFEQIQISKESWLTALTLTKYFNLYLDWLTHHAWSLSIEEHFYILWPFVMLSGTITRKYIVFFLILIVPVLRVYLHIHPIEWMCELTIFLRIDAIATGCFFALFADKIIGLLNPYWIKVFYLSITALFFLRYFPLIANKFSLGFIFIPLGITHGTLANILISLIMMCSVYCSKGFWFKLLNYKWINYLGLLSYSLYLWQQILVFKTQNWITHFPQNIFFILLIAMCSYHFIEKPFLKLKNKFIIKT